MTRPLGLLARLCMTLALALAVLPAVAQAAGPPPVILPTDHDISYSIWTINGSQVRVRFMLPKTQAYGLVAPGEAVPDINAVGAAIEEKIGVASAGGDCTPIDQGQGVGEIYVLALTPGLDQFEIVYDCPSAQGLVLRNGALFGRIPGHTNYAQIWRDSDEPALRTFSKERQALALGDGAPKDDAVSSWASEGAHQMSQHFDRLCILAGVLLLAASWRELGITALAVCAGYLTSLAAALSGFMNLDPNLGGPAIGVTISLLGLAAWQTRPPDNAPARGWVLTGRVALGLAMVAAIVAAALKSDWTGLAVGGLCVFGLAFLLLAGTRPRQRWMVIPPAVMLGILDGSDMAGDIAILKPPRTHLAPILLGYDMGAAAAAIGLGLVAAVTFWLINRKLSRLRIAAVDFASASLVGAGLFWFVSRLYG